MLQDTTPPVANEGAKPFWMSKTLWGAAIGGLGLAVSAMGYRIDPATQAILVDQATAAISAVAGLIGTILVIVGRIRADRTLTVKKV